MRTTYYDTLQVSRRAHATVIRASYKALTQKHHPDKHPGDEARAHRNMALLNDAYEVLSDPQRRAAYDKVLQELELAERAAQQAAGSQERAVQRTRASKGAFEGDTLPAALAALTVLMCLLMAFVGAWTGPQASPALAWTSILVSSSFWKLYAAKLMTLVAAACIAFVATFAVTGRRSVATGAAFCVAALLGIIVGAGV